MISSNGQQTESPYVFQTSLGQSKFVVNFSTLLGGKSAQNTVFYYLNSSSTLPESPGATSNHKTAYSKQIILPKSPTFFVIYMVLGDC